jgi:hypothetical protein
MPAVRRLSFPPAYPQARGAQMEPWLHDSINLPIRRLRPKSPRAGNDKSGQTAPDSSAARTFKMLVVNDD